MALISSGTFVDYHGLEVVGCVTGVPVAVFFQV